MGAASCHLCPCPVQHAFEYHEVPAAEKLARLALATFEVHRLERARLTRDARLDPVRLELLARGFEQIGIVDPDGRIARQLAICSRDAIAYGLATYLAKQQEGTIPPDAIPHRYLGGIIRNRHESRELALTGQYLLEQRLLLRDLALAPLEVQAERIRASVLALQLPLEFVDQALRIGPTIDFRFWTTLAARAIASLAPAIGRSLYPNLCQRIAQSFSTNRDRRANLIDALAAASNTSAGTWPGRRSVRIGSSRTGMDGFATR